MKSISRESESIFGAFMDLENAYDTIDQHGMWQKLTRVWSWTKIVECGVEHLCVAPIRNGCQ